eukprot:Nk52_evm4s387 gene=Nk52_evmTU4s387
MEEQSGDSETQWQELVEELEDDLWKEIPLGEANMELVFDELDQEYLFSFKKEVQTVNERLAEKGVQQSYPKQESYAYGAREKHENEEQDVKDMEQMLSVAKEKLLKTNEGWRELLDMLTAQQ